MKLTVAFGARSLSADRYPVTKMRAQDPNAWRQSGVVHLWRYTENVKNYPGWHLATDENGYRSLLDLLVRLQSSDRAGAVRTVKLTPPSTTVLAVPNNRRSPAVSPSRAQFALAEVPDRWGFNEADGILQIAVGPDHLNGLIRWLSDPDAAFDSTYGNAPPVWFWGTVPTKHARAG